VTEPSSSNNGKKAGTRTKKRKKANSMESAGRENREGRSATWETPGHRVLRENRLL
jgi:hypothetical protein